jgi:hypothetical protein
VLRLTEQQYKELEAARQKAGDKTISQWVRRMLQLDTEPAPEGEE